MMKRIFALLTVLALLCGCAAAEEAAETPAWTYNIVEVQYPTYFFNMRYHMDKDTPLYFADGAMDMPYMDVRDWCDAMNYVFADIPGYKGYQVTFTNDGLNSGLVSLRRENSSIMTCNFEDGEIVFDDYDAFNTDNYGLNMNIAGEASFTPDEANILGVISSRERHGKSISVNLKEYGIPMIAQDGKYLMPLQTLSYLTFSRINFGAFFNGKALIFAFISNISNLDLDLINELFDKGFMTREMWKEAGEKTQTPAERIAYVLEVISQDEKGREFIEFQREKQEGTISNLYYSAPKGERSETLAAFGYNELCMELDQEYGLKDTHNIKGFAEYFEQTGLTEKLLSLNVSDADNAIGALTRFWLDDGHSGFGSNSYLTDFVQESWDSGYSIRRSDRVSDETDAIRKKYENATEPYYEIGNTAYITFDEFKSDPDISEFSEYYKLDAEDELPDDTFAQVIEAHRKITRENSPITNVVLDLSCNGGGAAKAGVFLLCWFLGETQISAIDPLTGAESTVSYKADINLDHKYDEKDNLSHLNLYCLVSPLSFSCANLAAWAFKEDGRVTLLGKTSGGGSCVVRQMTTAWGSTFQISGTSRISFVKNGSYYDVDRGVEPDVFIRDYNNFYDREALSDIINGIR